MKCFIDGIGLFATGLPSWPAAQAVLRGEQAYEAIAHPVPPPEWLPPAERRRTSDIIRLAMCAGREALEHAQQAQSGTYTVFTSSGGSGEVIHQICEALAQPEREVSPTRFHNSVHNAPAGYWGIASRSEFPSTSLCGHDASFGVGLLEAVAQVHATDQPVLLLAHDLSYPEPLHGVRPVEGLFSVALLLRAQRSERSIAVMDVELVPDQSNNPVTTVGDSALEAFRTSNPAARCLPLLARLAKPQASPTIIQASNGAVLAITLDKVDGYTVRLSQDDIRKRIPHSGPMCLLNSVEFWDAEQITCTAVSHLDVNNPLRQNNQLDALNAIEYAAQAMAVHGALLSERESQSNEPKVGYLASVRDVQCHVTRLDDLQEPLEINAKQLTSDGVRMLYEFQVTEAHDNRLLVTGRAAVVLDVGAPT